MPYARTPKPFQPIILLDGERTAADNIAERMVWAMHAEVKQTMNTERTAQVEIGLSEIGNECERCLSRQVSGLYHIESPNWKAQVGTFGHEGLERALHARYDADAAEAAGTLFLHEVDPTAILHLEEAVELPVGDGTVIPGHCDLFIEGVDYGIVWDHKFLGGPSMKQKTAGHVGQKYDVQLDGYGLGWELKGKLVTHVALGALPRDGDVNEAAFILRRYDRDNIVRVLAKIADIRASAAIMGWERFIQAQPRDPGCWDCPRFEALEDQEFFAGFTK